MSEIEEENQSPMPRQNYFTAHISISHIFYLTCLIFARVNALP